MAAGIEAATLCYPLPRPTQEVRHESRREPRRPRDSRVTLCVSVEAAQERTPILRSRSADRAVLTRRQRRYLARTIQPSLSAALGPALVIDNRGGASSVIGTELAARAPADGYTMLLVTTTHTVNPSLIEGCLTTRSRLRAGLARSVAAEPSRDPSFGAREIGEGTRRYAKSKGAPLTYASGGSGSSPHLSGELFRLVAAIDLTHVPFKGSGPGVDCAARRSGHHDVCRSARFEPHISSGKLRALAVADRKRSSILPDVPTMAEAGFPGIQTGTWFGSSRLPRRQPGSCRRSTTRS